ncbi:RNA polymerase sigma factor [Cohnella pontilimi]|uniref:RNA polymerase sigma factor n=1 Tax=Cohnella pontilimi TaxID=2564100 RepID=A0A4U0F862_9BACL|nr:RNA polymerase sigma factor [Cohnella pontilimi]TJY40811.1 RNA polymerase sigma factor [Cohnella pontilimi]
MESEYWKVIERFDAEAFRELMLTYGQEIWNYAFFLTKNPDYADDITQEVFLKVYGQIGSFRGESSIRTWLLAITRNMTFNYRRSTFLRRVVLVGAVSRRDSHPSAEQEALTNTLSNELWEIIMNLPVKFREVLVLNARYELSQREIAGLLGLSEGTVKSRLSRARQKVSVAWKEGTVYDRATT